MSPKEVRRASGSVVLAPAVSEASTSGQQQAPPTPSAEGVDEAAALIETLLEGPLEGPKRKRRYRKSQPQV